MSSKVILFCALLFGSKFVAPVPFDEELGQQRALQSNSWQRNVNTPEQYQGFDLTRVHSINAKTNSAQQYPTGREFETNRERQHNENYKNNFPHSLYSLPAISNPVNVAPGSTNDHRKDGFVSRVDSFPIRNQHHPIRVDNQFKQQNWQLHSRFENPTLGAIDNVATAPESLLSIQKPYHNSGQAIQPPPVTHQHYQGDNLNPKDLRYYPVPQQSGINRYMHHPRRNFGPHTRPVHYESYNKAQEHNINIANSKHNIYVEKDPVLSRSHNPHVFENNDQPGLKSPNGPGSYIVPPGFNNNKNIHVAPITTGIINHPSAPRYPPINPRYNGQPLHTNRHMEKPIIHSEPNNHAHDTYFPTVPLDVVLDEGANTRHITKEPNNYASLNTFNINPIIQKDSAASNDDVILKLTNDDGLSDTKSDDKKPDIFSNIPEENPNENIYDFSEGENVKEFFSDKIKNNFVIIYANGTVEYVKHLDTDDDPDYVVVKKSLVESPHVTFNGPPESKQAASNILDSSPDKTNDYDSSVTSNDNNYNKPPLHVEDVNNSPLLSQSLYDNRENNSLSVPELQQSQDTKPLPLLESTVFNENLHTGPLDNYNPDLGTLASHGNNHNWDSEPHENKQTPYNSNKNDGYPRWPSKLLTHIPPTGIHTSTSPASDDVVIQEFLDSHSIKPDKEQQLSDSGYYSPQDENTPNQENNHPKHLDTDDDPDYVVVKKSLVESPHVTFNSPPESKQAASNILDSLPDKTNDYDSLVTSNDNNYNKPPLHVEDVNNLPLLSPPLYDNRENNSLSVPELHQSQDTKPLLESTVFNKNLHSGPLDNYNPELGTLTSHENNHNRDSESHENKQAPYNSNKNDGYPRWPSKLLTHIPPTGIHTSTSPASDDVMIQTFLDSLSIKPDREQQLSDSNYYSPQDENTPNQENNHPTSHANTTKPPSQLHTVISPGIFKSTTLGSDNLKVQKHQDLHPHITVTSSILSPSKIEEGLKERTTPIPHNSDSDNNPNSTTEDQIITISPIELITDNVKYGSSPTPEDKRPLKIESVYANEKLDKSDYNSKSSYDTTTSQPSNTYISHKTESVDNVSTQVTNRVEIEINNTKSACNNSLEHTGDPEKYDDNTAAPTNQNDVNTDKTTGYSSLELNPPKNGLEITLKIPNDSDGTLYIKVDAPDGYTGHEGTSSNDTLLVSITRQNNSDIDLITVKNDSDGHDYFNAAVTNSDEENPTKNLKLDLSDALVVMNGTNDKEYLNQLLSSDSKVNLFIFQMPCQDQAIVEKFKETTIYPNGTCIELLTETRWKNKDDPSPVIITMKKIYGGGKCK